MTVRTMILSSFIWLLLLPLTSYAKVDYISLHEIESPARQPLSVKLNIVEVDQESLLKFTLLSQNKETKLDYQRINNYMLRLKSPHSIMGKTSVLVYEFEQGTWQLTHTVDVPNSLVPPKTDEIILTKNTDLKTQCKLIREPKETLWSIASRYKDQWSVDIYSAMLAIYQSNLNKFAKQHIGQLIKNVELSCPSAETITKMGRKQEMKAEFNRLIKPSDDIAY